MRLLILLIASLLVISYVLQRKESFSKSLNIYPTPNINFVTLIVDNDETIVNIYAPNVDFEKLTISVIDVDVLIKNDELSLESVDIVSIGEEIHIELKQGENVIVIESDQNDPGLYIDFLGEDIKMTKNESIDVSQLQKETQTVEQLNAQIEAQKFIIRNYIQGNVLEEVMEEAVAISKSEQNIEGEDYVNELDSDELSRGLKPVIKRLKFHLPKHLQ